MTTIKTDSPSAKTAELNADYTADYAKNATAKCSPHFGQVITMSNHNQLNWSDFLLCIGMELAYHNRGERPIQEQIIAEKIISLGGEL